MCNILKKVIDKYIELCYNTLVMPHEEVLKMKMHRIRRVLFKEVYKGMYAIIETGGKQYKVAEGDIITVEKLGVEAESKYTFDKVLAVCDGDSFKFGADASAATVEATVMGDGKAKKVIVYKYKPKKGFHKKNGHRQPFTQLKIEKING